MFGQGAGYHIFTFRDIRVHANFWFLVLIGFVVFGNGNSAQGFAAGAIFAVALTLSLLVHEFGHAFVSKHYGLSPAILLHGFGGLCAHRPAEKDLHDGFIVLAGPLVEIAFGILAFIVALFVHPAGRGVAVLMSLVSDFAWVSVVWGGINLVLPIWPLDGGQLFNLILRRFMAEEKAQRVALITSVSLIIPLGIFSVMVMKDFWLALLAILLVMDNINVLRSGQMLIQRDAKDRTSDYHKEMLDGAEAALADGDWREAARLCHLMRSTGSISAKALQRCWAILGIATTHMGNYEEAMGYLKRAPDTREVRQSWQQCQEALQGGETSA